MFKSRTILAVYSFNSRIAIVVAVDDLLLLLFFASCRIPLRQPVLVEIETAFLSSENDQLKNY